MSPEIVQKKEYRGETADVWALGVMLFVMLTGYFPYKGATDEELYRKINSADYPKHDLNKLAAHLLARIFTLEPEQRITAEAVTYTLYRSSHTPGSQKHPKTSTKNKK